MLAFHLDHTHVDEQGLRNLTHADPRAFHCLAEHRQRSLFFALHTTLRCCHIHDLAVDDICERRLASLRGSQEDEGVGNVGWDLISNAGLDLIKHVQELLRLDLLRAAANKVAIVEDSEPDPHAT